MNQPNKAKQFLIIGGVVFAVVIIILTIVVLVLGKNPYGESINIVNYGQKVKNLSRDYEDNIEARLYQAALFSSEEEFNGSDVKDAYIREGSDTQSEITKNVRYSGSFIVDIESRKESYKVEYAYSSREDDDFTAGYPISVGCVNPDEVKYESFDCKDGTTENALKGADSIINFLPHETVSYTLSAELIDDALILRAELFIPTIDLSGNVDSRREVVALYKSEVTSWITAQGFNPEDYTIEYNYTEDGVYIETDEHNHEYADEITGYE